jgi:hypothetical protein
MADASTVVFWGAGATAALGMRVTEAQGQFIARLAGVDKDTSSKNLRERVRIALDKSDKSCWNDCLFDLITILGDTESARASIHVIEGDHIEAMRRHWKSGAGEDDLRRRIMALRLIYDWPALKDVIEICPGARSDKFKINDLFNVLDMHAPLGHGFRAEEGRFLDARRLLGAKAALKMLLHVMFYIDYQVCVEDRRSTLDHYYSFSEWLGKRMQAACSATTDGFDRPEFIRGDISFVSLNYDPIALWSQFVANRNLNGSSLAPKVGTPAVPLQIFHDMGHFIPSRRVEPNSRPALWYPMNEASAQRLNETSVGASQRIRLSKFLFPHGCLCWRECPDCGKLSAYHGDSWDLDSQSLFPPPPLKGFEHRSSYPDIGTLNDMDRVARLEEKARWEEGAVDARACLHCDTLTSTHHTQTVMQSSFKQAPPSFIDEIQRDLRALVMRADHVVLMGYSLPPDDVSYRSFFAARRQRYAAGHGKGAVRCTIVGLDSGNPGWTDAASLEPSNFPEGHVVHSALEIFGIRNVRFYGDGVPKVFLDSSGKVSEVQFEQLVTWSGV